MNVALKILKMKYIPKKNVILKTKDMNQKKTNGNYYETVIFRLYFKVIITQNEIQLHAKVYIYKGPMTIYVTIFAGNFRRCFLRYVFS